MAAPLKKMRAGIGARDPHIAQILADTPNDFGWLEVHPENYMSAGGALLKALADLRALYPLSLHGVGLSLVSVERLDRDHLAALKHLVDRFDPFLVSEHLAWSAWEGRFYNDLFPVPMNEEALAIAIERVDEAQSFLGRQILVENPSLYGALSESTMAETEFLSHLAKRTGCGLLLDLNNVFVSANNLGFNAHRWLDDFPTDAVGEIHLSGHAVIEFEGRSLCIDDHGSAIKASVWQLAQDVLAQIGAKPILIEWDKNIPPLETLCAAANKAQALLDALPPKPTPQKNRWIYTTSNTASPLH